MKLLTIIFILVLHTFTISYSNIFKESAKLAKKFNMPQDIIIAVARAESDFKQYKTSKSGAVGVMQITPICYKHYKEWYPRTIHTNFNVMRKNWRANMFIGTWYLKKICYRKYRNWKLAITAYFWGPWSKKTTNRYYATVVKKSKLKIN